MPKGEIFIRGNSIFKGYYKNFELTKSVLDENGWLKLNDIGILNLNGSIRIIDRIVEMKKSYNGKMISPMNLESIYKNAPLIN